MFPKSNTGLRVRPNRGETLPFPQFEKPRPIGYFSVVGGTLREYEPSAQQLRYYKPPAAKKFPLDLNEGLHLAIKKPESVYDEGLDHIFKFIFDHRDRLTKPLTASETSQRSLNAEFVCWRGLLRLLMSTPYEFRSDWSIVVTRFNGTFYLRKRDTEQEKFQRAQETEQQRVFASWGFKFEQYCLSESPFLEPNDKGPVDECSEFSCVFKTKLAGFELLYGAEMDGIISEQPVLLEGDKATCLENLKFIEVKVRQGNLNRNQIQSYNRHKTRNWWCQSFLVGIQDIYVGLRNEYGLVDRIEHTEVRSLPKQGMNHWTPNMCVTFLIEFFNRVRSLMTDVNCPYTVFEFYFNSNRGTITFENIKGKSEHSFLPDYFIELMHPKPPVINEERINLQRADTVTVNI
ncbi:PREDICTED: decapping nuclease DXO homolog [Rhagoletis zephyria]|uniref:decapping nuclease DXO homolog n=1 Tax=Rhagoletis zephyria TaxID=28612 RepID=UPI0008115915|nr:PREDICTED: decapping nuclease DXO homolog [Rhagoletis zephyria]